MNSTEIRNLIEKKIEGQGNQVDLGNALPVILKGLSERMSGTAEVAVKIHAYKKNEDETSWEPDIEGVSGILYVKGFDTFGNPLPVQEIPFTGEADAETIDITIEAHQGDTIAVLAKIPGKGASCQLVTKVLAETTLEPEVYPAGIYEIGDGNINITPGKDGYGGTAIVTEDFAIAFPAYQNETFENPIPFGPRGQAIPGVLATESEQKALTDFDGALNTAAIIFAINGDSAAKAANKPTPKAQYTSTGFFLPSLGILKYLFEHKAEINAFIAAENKAYGPDTDYQQIGNQYCWSSTLYDIAVRVWMLGFGNGNTRRDDRYSDYRVCAVSAFQTLY